MAAAKAIRTGDARAGARLEYVRTRRVFRLGAWHQDGQEVEAVEVPASRLLTELGVAPDELGATPVFLVDACVRQGSRGPLRQVLAAFPNEVEARKAFRDVRGDRVEDDEWGQILTIDARCRLVRLCWFGEPGQIGLDGADAGVTPARARRWGPRRLRGSAGR
jgi:hypothetical protein